MKIPKLEYEVYYPLHNNQSLTKLNLAYCKNTKIEILITASINETLDKYNPDSDYYNEICSKSTSKSGTDIPIKIRRNDFMKIICLYVKKIVKSLNIIIQMKK